MKKLLKFSLTGVFLLLCGLAYGQKKAQYLEAKLTEKISIYENVLTGVPGSFVLREQEQKIREYVKAHPEILKRDRMHKSSAWGFNVGDTYSWWATNMSEDKEYEVKSTCRAVGNNCYIFVQDSQWVDGGNGRVSQASVDSIKKYFDLYTPADPVKGIYQTDVETFGTPPDFDSDPKIIILILNIQDDFPPGSSTYVAGYFFSLNQYADNTWPGRRSNEAEIYYIDSDPADLNSNNGLIDAMSTTAHEFQHMIHWGKDSDEMTFIDEGCATAAEVVCGFSIFSQHHFTDDPNQPLLQWSAGVDVLRDYARAARWTVYLCEQFSEDYLKDLVAESQNGIEGINEALKAITPSTSRRFMNVFEDWCIANYLNDKTVADGYGYSYSALSPVRAENVYLDPNVSNTSGVVKKLAAQYITFCSGSDLKATFNSTASSLVVKAIKKGSTVVEDVPLNSEYSVPDFGTTYSEVTFILINKDRYSNASYTYTASGTSPQEAVEIAYDDGQPEGYLSVGDTLAVVFEGLTGTTLDSMRVAFRRAGTITMGINRYSAMSLIGQEIISPMEVKCTTESPYPYPDPFENWVTVDLTSYNINADSDYIIWFEVTDHHAPAVMISSEPDDGDYHSYTYSSDHGRWVIFNDGEGNVYNYLVHSYLGVSTAVEDNKLLSNIPDKYLLSQNFPNPFNPVTTIKYGLPESQYVSLTVYDIMGRRVAQLVDENKDAGYHTVELDASALSSGIYFYHLQAGSYTNVRKMMIIK